MKRKILFSILTLAGLQISHCNGQMVDELFNSKDSTSPKPIFGVKAGANIQTITGSDWIAANNAGILAGFFAGLHKNRISVTAEMTVSTTSYKSKVTIDSDGNIGNFNVISLNIPLLFSYSFLPNLAVQIGPQYSNMVSVSKKSPFDADPKVLFRAGQFSGVIGLEGQLPHHILVGGRYIYGLTDLNNQAFTSTQVWNTRAVQVYAGYSFR